MFLGSLLVLSLISQKSTTPKFSHPDRIRYDGHCFTIEGKDTFIFSGAFHYFRCPKELWRERFKSIKAAGFNAVETYAAWNYSEVNKPKNLNDFSQMDLSELDEWLTMAEKEFGLYTIVRPGPYICAEWATGGYPNWLLAFRPEKTKQNLWFRSDDPTYLDWCHHWFKAVTRVVKTHQLTAKKPGDHGVILFQLENEYGDVGVPVSARLGQVKALMQYANEGGITIPYFTCWTDVVRNPKGDSLLTQAFDTPNIYCRWNIQEVADAIRDQHNAEPWAPKMVTELQGGWFGNVGNQAAEEQDGISATQISSLTLYAIQNGLTSLNYYMLFGGTNFGDWAGQGITTCYDYFAPIREWGGTGEKYRQVQAIGKFLKAHGSDLARSDDVSTGISSDNASVTIGARKGKSGATYLFVRNTSRTNPVQGQLAGGPTYNLEPFAMNVFRYEKVPTDGTWQIEPVHVAHSMMRIAPIRLKDAELISMEASNWRAAPEHPTNVNLGVYNSQFIEYRSKPAKGTLWMQVASGDLISGDGTKPNRRPGGYSYPLDGSSKSFLLFNPGWANGGPDMERARGIVDARVIDRLPIGLTITNWKGIAIPANRANQAPAANADLSKYVDVETNSSTQSIFDNRKTVELRASFEIKELPKGGLTVNFGGIDDDGWIYVNGHFVGETHDWAQAWSFNIGPMIKAGQNELVVIVKNTDGPGGINGPVTIAAPIAGGKRLGFEWTNTFVPSRKSAYILNTDRQLERIVHPRLSGERPTGPLMVRSRITFAKPNFGDNAIEIILDAGGDGFLTLNGHGLGRYWEVGPQRAYFIPKTWLKAQNILEFTATPGRLGDRINAAELRALKMIE